MNMLASDRVNDEILICLYPTMFLSPRKTSALLWIEIETRVRRVGKAVDRKAARLSATRYEFLREHHPGS